MKQKIRSVDLRIRIEDFDGNPESRWSCCNLHDDRNIHAARWLHRYDLKIDSANEDLAASSMVDELVYLVLECPTTKEACEKLALIRRFHRELAAREQTE
jgi:hypothetical protein